MGAGNSAFPELAFDELNSLLEFDARGEFTCDVHQAGPLLNASKLGASGKGRGYTEFSRTSANVHMPSGRSIVGSSLAKSDIAWFFLTSCDKVDSVAGDEVSLSRSDLEESSVAAHQAPAHEAVKVPEAGSSLPVEAPTELKSQAVPLRAEPGHENAARYCGECA